MWLACWVGLFAVMHTPGDRLPKIHISNLDKAAHVIGYLLLALLGGATARRAGATMGVGWYVRWFMVYAVYAAADELTQPLVRRTADVFDWVADMAGVTLAMAIVYIDASRARRASSRR